MSNRRFESKQELQKRLATLQRELNSPQHELQAFVRAAKVPRSTVPDLQDQKNHRIDARKVARYLGVPLDRLSEALKRQYSSVRSRSSAKSLQTSLSPLKRTIESLHNFFPDPANARIWLNCPHHALGNLTAMEAILAGKCDAVMLLLENAAAGVPV